MVTDGTVDPGELAALLELSDLMDRQLVLRLRAYREGWQAAEQARADDYSTGYADGTMGHKHAQHDAVEALKLYMRRWSLRGQRRSRRTFSAPHPDDCGPGEAARRARASWEPLGLGPGPGWVHLGGRYVHQHRCVAACRGYEPGWYRTGDAIAILAALPGGYAETIASLRAMTAAPGRSAA